MNVAGALSRVRVLALRDKTQTAIIPTLVASPTNCRLETRSGSHDTLRRPKTRGYSR